MAGVLYRSLMSLSPQWQATKLCSELLHESLGAHAVLVHVLHEIFVVKVGMCCSNVQEVKKKEFPVPLHSFVLGCVILDQLV